LKKEVLAAFAAHKDEVTAGKRKPWSAGAAQDAIPARLDFLR
jgi:hypothetical protein